MRHVLSLVYWILGNDLHPVPIRVQCEGNTPHPSVAEFFLEFVTGIFKSFAGSLDIVDRDANMTKAFAGLTIAIGDFVVRIVLSA